MSNSALFVVDEGTVLSDTGKYQLLLGKSGSVMLSVASDLPPGPAIATRDPPSPGTASVFQEGGQPPFAQFCSLS